MEEHQSLKRLHMDDTYVPGGKKRSAASPSDEYMLSMPLNTSRVRELSPRRSPQGLFHLSSSSCYDAFSPYLAK
ncbi:unnamed protein product [Fusarium graminearum]|uniref:Uncharacterized protein n=1 Tax=Gibberella zeae TaxID=5518 RepID=A0A9N8WXV6_GIBZA|nr:unnamed protein product [Fusarium graminearum]